MNLTLRQMRYLSEAATLGSLQGAAKKLSISQSSVLAAVNQAETELGISIFARKRSKGVSLTPAGLNFIGALRGLLSAHADFTNQVGSLATGVASELRLGCFEPFGAMFMTPVLRDIQDRTRLTTISLLEGDQQQLQAWLNSGDVDAVVTYDIGYTFENCTEICKVPTHAAVHMSDPAVEPMSISLEEIAARPLVLLDLPLTASFLTAIFDTKGLRPRVAFRTRNYETARSAVAHGFGIALLNMRPKSAISADPKELIRVPISDEVACPKLIIADLYGEKKPSSLQILISALGRYFNENKLEGPSG